MANTYNQNTCAIDSTGDSGIGTGKGRIKLFGVIFVPDANNDEIELRNSSGGAVKFYTRAATAKETKFIDLANKPILFNDAIHVQTLSSSARAILIVEVTQ